MFRRMPLVVRPDRYTDSCSSPENTKLETKNSQKAAKADTVSMRALIGVAAAIKRR